MNPVINRRHALASSLALGSGLWLSGSARAAESAHPEPRASDRLPDLPLVNHRGEKVRFYSDLIADRPVVINMMYVNCRGTCPGTSTLLTSLWPALDEAIGPELRIIFITLDPETDTPQELAEYASAYAPRGAAKLKSDWQFLTGKPQDTEAIRKALGLTDPDPKIDQDRTQHAALLTFGNDRLNRWASLPVEIPKSQMLKTITRILRGANSSAKRS